MENKTNNGSGDKWLDFAAYVLAAILFLKTADVLSYFAPQILNLILGFDVSFVYGSVCAVLVEGAALALHFNSRAGRSSAAQIVKWILLGISGACQVFDGFITAGNVAQMSDTLKFGLSYGVPLIPLAVLVMLFTIGKLPEDGTPPKQWKGLRNIVRPAWDKLINGESVGNLTETVVLAKDVPHVEEVESVGKTSKTSQRSQRSVGKKPNFTQGKDAAE